MKLILSVDALADLTEIHRFSSRRWGAVRAGAYIDDLRDRMKALAQGETSGRAADDVRLGLRRLVVASHVVWFRVDAETLRVVPWQSPHS